MKYLLILLLCSGCYALKPMPQIKKYDSVEQKQLYRARQHANWYRK